MTEKGKRNSTSSVTMLVVRFNLINVRWNGEIAKRAEIPSKQRIEIVIGWTATRKILRMPSSLDHVLFFVAFFGNSTMTSSKRDAEFLREFYAIAFALAGTGSAQIFDFARFSLRIFANVFLSRLAFSRTRSKRNGEFCVANVFSFFFLSTAERNRDISRYVACFRTTFPRYRSRSIRSRDERSLRIVRRLPLYDP